MNSVLRTSTVILAAGASKRLGFNKLCVRVDGEAVIRKTARFFVEAGAGEIVVVTGFERERVERELAGLPVAFVHNARHEDGMSASIRAALPIVARSDLVLFHLGDKPFLEPGIVQRLLEKHGEGAYSIIVSAHEGVRGHPVLVDMRKHLPAVSAVNGEGGLRDVVEGSGTAVAFLEAGEGVVLDLDTAADMNSLKRRGYTIEKG
jgi:molybdenum cofactor cytidylyltransferase